MKEFVDLPIDAPPEPAGALTTDPGAATRAALVEAARRVFARAGFDGASVRRITGEAGVNLGAITYHFGSKRGLYDAVLEECVRPLVARVRAAAQGPGPALDRIVAALEGYFEHLAAHPELPYLLLQEIAAGKQPPPAVMALIREVMETLSGLHRLGEQDGSVRHGAPVLTALSVVAQPVYMTLVAPMLRSVAHVDMTEPASRRAVVAHAADFVRHGLQPREEAQS